jgi:hypothetical protein
MLIAALTKHEGTRQFKARVYVRQYAVHVEAQDDSPHMAAVKVAGAVRAMGIETDIEFGTLPTARRLAQEEGIEVQDKFVVEM